MMPELNKTWQSRVGTTRMTAGRIGRLAVFGLAALAGLHVVWDFFFHSPVDVVSPARTVVNQSAVVSSFAQDFVSVWLTATSTNPGSITQFISVKGADLKLPSTPAVVIDAPTVVTVTNMGRAGKDGAAAVFAVVVGVTQRAYESAAPVRALYRVPVLWSKYGPRAISLPDRISDVGAGADVAMAYPESLGAKDPLFAVVSGFITAYLTKAGGVDRYVTADSRLTGLGDAYQSATVTALSATETPTGVPQDGDTVRALAKVTAITSQYAPTELVYPLTLNGVGGRWSVAAIDRAPVMSTDRDPVPVVTSSTSK
jgi:Conjugative transposon protein TcpC